MIYRIPAGKHRARPWCPWLWWGKTSFTWIVSFDESCRYDLQNDDQFDTNKLVGIGYLWHHHKNSARFGWRYWTERREIALSAYCYVNGRRVIEHVAFCEIGKEYIVKLKVLAMSYYFEVTEPGAGKPAGSTFVDHYHEKKLAYRLAPFFGGTSSAPHNIAIKIENV
jgi:hypothetical protein